MLSASSKEKDVLFKYSFTVVGAASTSSVIRREERNVLVMR
jgi:hypothetical protein